jgi:ATP-binding cassette, subfamily B, bacterial PglK
MHPTAGRILVDGTEITRQNVRAWRESVGYVPQSIFLADATIRENIALGLPAEAIDDARVHEVCRIAQLEQFIETDLPEGYNTTVGERGARLSGGQRQRIGIARALYRHPDFIVFDEATSALDNVTETVLMAAIDALPAKSTVLMIAHRLATVRHCDRIAILDAGHLAGQGGWDELMATSPLFREMASAGKAA